MILVEHVWFLIDMYTSEAGVVICRYATLVDHVFSFVDILH